MKKELTGYATIDKPWQKYYPNANISEEEVKQRIEKSIFQMLDECTKDIEDSVAIEYYGQQITYKEFKKKIYECAKSFLLLGVKPKDVVARSLRSMGVKPKDVVPLILPNQPESRISIYALNLIGATAYPIQPSITPKQLNQIIYENNARNLMIFRGFYRQYKVQMDDIENIIYTTAKESLPKTIQKLDNISHLRPSRVIPYTDFILESNAYKTKI